MAEAQLGWHPLKCCLGENLLSDYKSIIISLSMSEKFVKLCNRALTSAPSFFLCDIVREGGLDETVPRIEH